MTAKYSTAKPDRSAYSKAWRAANKQKIKDYLASYYIANRDKMRAQNAERYRANPDPYKKRARQWERDNIDRKRELRAQYRAENREKIREFSRIDLLKHGDKRRSAHKAYRVKFPEIGAHYCRLRQTRKQQATPAWADLNAIKAFYKEAARLRKQTGTKWHVDHIVPLKHPLACGLHNEFNLRVIPASENQSKGNRLCECSA